MEKLGVKKSGVLAVLLIALFVTSVFSMTTNAEKPVVIKIGVISDDYYLASETNLYVGVVQKDINAYVAKLPADRFNPPVKFEFQVVSMGPDDTADESNAQLVKFHNEGINLIIGGWYSSQINDYTLAYLKNHNMVMISPTSNAPSLAHVDNLFRLTPSASWEGTIVAAMFANLGLTKAIVIERSDSFGSGVLGAFSPSFSSGNLFTYTFTPGSTTSFASALASAESEAESLSDLTHVGVFLIAIDTDCAELNSPPSPPRMAFRISGNCLGSVPMEQPIQHTLRGQM